MRVLIIKLAVLKNEIAAVVTCKVSASLTRHLAYVLLFWTLHYCRKCEHKLKGRTNRGADTLSSFYIKCSKRRNYYQNISQKGSVIGNRVQMWECVTLELHYEIHLGALFLYLYVSKQTYLKKIRSYAMTILNCFALENNVFKTKHLKVSLCGIRLNVFYACRRR